ncbi:hypothetical protein [Metabacillus malikii]|uniref:Uncharacterized protein n=1 Tax=Metabacillus malikii TaxID=1504265 RepID=A0ABT9ZK65_9BACI|nr:hypothetical protein [Metabacillus malikii]MDQ0232691.1 hypothetical protein [Metabacillus malikii]
MVKCKYTATALKSQRGSKMGAIITFIADIFAAIAGALLKKKHDD